MGDQHLRLVEVHDSHTEEDVLDFVSSLQPREALFVRADLHHLGVSSELHRVFSIVQKNTLVGVLLWYRGTLIPITSPGLTGHLEDLPNAFPSPVESVRGLAEHVRVFPAEALGRCTSYVLHSCRQPAGPTHPNWEFLDAQDSEALSQVASLLATSGFHHYPGGAQVAAELRLGIRKVAAIRAGGQVVGTGTILGLGPQEGLIAAVATSVDWRGRGIGSACVTGLASYLTASGRTAFLMTRADFASTIYRRLGFLPDGTWLCCTTAALEDTYA